MKEEIKLALQTLDPDNNDHWTQDGLPRLDVVATLLGVDNPPNRRAVTDALPGFTRASAIKVEQTVAEDPALAVAIDPTNTEKASPGDVVGVVEGTMTAVEAFLRDTLGKHDNPLRDRRRYRELFDHCLEYYAEEMNEPMQTYSGFLRYLSTLSEDIANEAKVYADNAASLLQEMNARFKAVRRELHAVQGGDNNNVEENRLFLARQQQLREQRGSLSGPAPIDVPMPRPRPVLPPKV